MRHVFRHSHRYLGDWRDFHTGSDHNDEVCGVLVLLIEAVEEGFREGFMEESDVRL